ncbi:UAP56-interacting factor [Bombina bombina]|uniref:UAP56-interacting factor n=1 Tax=Bombina bombina TaxID=8345 RepID=UPI00235B15CF|nr:UAP56-interacting factor [Bombina bombina]
MVPHKASIPENIDKIDMSLDDIIRLNKQEQKKTLFNGRSPENFSRQFRSNWRRWRTQRQSGTGRKKRRSYGVKTGLAMRKMSSWKGISPLNRPPLSVQNSPGQRPAFRNRENLTRPPDFGSKPATSIPRYYLRSNYGQTSSVRSGFRMNQQRETRQATFLFRRGLKVQTLLDRDQHLDFMERNRTYPWRTSTSSGGMLTVSIDNPSAVVLPSSLGTRLSRPPLPFLMKKEGSEPKVPKGVPLEFDINSVAKQTGITLNERFKILKEQRLSQSLSKGSRFVTVG